MFDGDSNSTQILIPPIVHRPGAPMVADCYRGALAGAYTFAKHESRIIVDTRWPLTLVNVAVGLNTKKIIDSASLADFWAGLRYIPAHAERLYMALYVFGRDLRTTVDVQVSIQSGAKTLTSDSQVVTSGPEICRGSADLSGLTLGQRVDFTATASSADEDSNAVAVEVKRFVLWWGE